MFSVCNITFQLQSYVQIHVLCVQYDILSVCRFMFCVCNITFQIIVICASLYFLFAISHSKYMLYVQVYVLCVQYHILTIVCASFCFVFAISHSKYSHMCKFIFSVCNITFQIMSYVQVYVFCLQYHIPTIGVCANSCFLFVQYHIPNNVVCASFCFLFAISHSKIQSYVQVYVFCLQYHIPNNVVYASLYYLFAISHSKYSHMCKFIFSVCNLTFQIYAGSSVCNFSKCAGCTITFQIMSYVQVYFLCKFMQVCFLFAISHSK